MPVSFVSELLNLLTYAFVFAFVAGVLAVVVMYVIDITQTTHAIRRNFPVVGRFRYVFENLGEFFRQYFFAMDREELPFNRAERAWAYRAAKGVDSTVAFGSTRDLRPAVRRSSSMHRFRRSTRMSPPPSAVTIGPLLPDSLYTDRFFHISAMSFGAISRPGGAGAVAGCEGGRLLAEYRGRRSCAVSPGGWGGHRVPDGHGQIWRA